MVESSFINLCDNWHTVGLFSMKVGDLVKGWQRENSDPDSEKVGIIIEVIDHIEVPPVCKVFWESGYIDKEWTDDLTVCNENA